MIVKQKKIPQSREPARRLPSGSEARSAMREDVVSSNHLEDVIVHDIDLADTNIDLLSGSSLLLECVSFANTEVAAAHLTDVRFQHCDLSNTVFGSFDAVRVEFIDCKLVGMRAIGCNWKDVLLDRCDASFAQFSDGRLRNCEFTSSQLRDSAIGSVQLDGTTFREVDLRNTYLGQTKLAGIDLRGSVIDGISLHIADLRGVIVDAGQAISLARFLEVVIR